MVYKNRNNQWIIVSTYEYRWSMEKFNIYKIEQKKLF